MPRFFTVLIALLVSLQVQGQLSPQSLQIPMRDGKNLAADLYLPDTSGTYPVILIQTPYNKNFYQLTGLPLGIKYDQANSPYAFVVLDWRCFHGSLSACASGPTRGEDGYDAVEWISSQSWCDGKVGTWGPSALGNVQYLTAAEQPPHLICAMPEVASPLERYLQYYPGGAIRIESLQTLVLLFGASGFGLVIANPYYNLIWQITENSTDYSADINIPMLMVAGWFDINTEECLLQIDALRTASPLTVRDKHKILIGPWVHGGTGQASVGTAQQGDLNFPNAAHRNDTLGRQFFDFHLRNISNSWDTTSPYVYFQMGDNTWEYSPSWPPTGASPTRYYLHDDGSLRDMPPSANNGSQTFSYDPNDPSPTIGGKTLNLALLQGPYDQKDSVESRNDNLIYSSAVLTQDLEIQGPIKVHLKVSSDRIDTDIALRLTEVYPDGSSILLGESIQRMRFRNGFTVQDTAFMSPGTIYGIDLDFEDLAQTFQAGNRIRLIITSSNYPRFNRNMNTGGEMYPNNHIDTLVNPQIATNTIHCNSNQISWIEFPVYNGGPIAIEQSRDRPTFLLYPNPNQGNFHLESSQPIQRVSLFDLQGRQVYTQADNDQRHIMIQALSLPPGAYLCCIEQKTGQKDYQKFTIY